MVAGSELHSRIFCFGVFTVSDLGEPRQAGCASHEAIVVGPGYPDIRADGVGAGNNHFRLLPLPRIPSTLDLWDGRVSCGMETSGGDFLSAGVSDFHDPFVDPGGPDHLSTPGSGFQDCYFPVNRDWGSGYPRGQTLFFYPMLAWKWPKHVAVSGRCSR